MKTAKKVLCLMLVAAMAVGMIQFASAADFTDATDIKNKEAVDVLQALNIVEGENGSFYPAREVTRAEAAAIIARMMLKKATADNLPASATKFPDVASDHWASKYIAYCESQQIILGRSDGKFYPNGNVTAAELAIMLMRAIGVGTPSRYVGASWQMNAIVDAMDLEILDTDLDYTSAAKRDDVAQYTFNTLTYAIKETTVDATVYLITATQNTSDNFKAGFIGETKTTIPEVTAAATAAWIGATGTPTLGYHYSVTPVTATVTTSDTFGREKYGLEPTTVADEFGRPTQRTWKATGITKIGSYLQSSASVSYTTTVTGAKVFADLGLTENPTIKSIYVDGKNVTSTTASSSSLNYNNTTALPGSGVGVQTEVYKLSDGTYSISHINTYVAKVSSVTAATAVKGETVALLYLSGTNSPGEEDLIAPKFANSDNTFVKAGLKKDDIVLYRASYFDATETADTTDTTGYKIRSVDLATSEKVTATIYGDTSFTTAAKTYYYSAKNGVSTVNGFAETTVYLDSYGNPIYAGIGVDSFDVAYVVRTRNVAGEWSGAGTFEADLLMPNGTRSVVKTSTFWGDPDPDDSTPVGYQGKIVAYKIADGGKYEIDATTYDTGISGIKGVKTTKGSPAFTVGGSTLYGDASTFYVIRTGSTAATYAYNAYIGYANVPSISESAGRDATVYYGREDKATSGVVDAVLIEVTATSAASGDVVFLGGKLNDSHRHYTSAGYYWEAEVQLNGKAATMKFDSNYDVGLYTEVSTSASGITTLGSTVLNNATPSSISYSGSVLVYKNAFDSNKDVYVTLDASVQVFSYSTINGAVTAVSTSLLPTTTTIKTFGIVTNSAGYVTYIYINDLVA